MATGAWSNDDPRDVVVPPGAGPNDPQIFIGPDVPPELVAYYASSQLTQACILFLDGDGNYIYMVSGDTGSVAHTPFWAIGGVSNNGAIIIEVARVNGPQPLPPGNSGTFFEIFSKAPSPANNSSLGEMLIGLTGLGQFLIVQTDFVFFQDTDITIQDGAQVVVQDALVEYQAGTVSQPAAVLQIDGPSVGRPLPPAVNFGLGAGLNYNSVPMGRGLAYGLQLPIGTIPAPSGSDTVLLTFGVFTYRAGRAYRFAYHGPAVTTGALSLSYRLRRGTTAAGVTIAVWNYEHPATPLQEDSIWATITNSTGADITENVTLWIRPNTGTATVTIANPGEGQILVEDIGDAAFFPGNSANW